MKVNNWISLIMSNRKYIVLQLNIGVLVALDYLVNDE